MRVIVAVHAGACALSLIAGFWERLVSIRAAVLRVLGPGGWAIIGVLFMASVIAVMRAGGKSDATDL